MPTPPGAVRWIARTLEEAGHPTWVVGGAVRDGRLGVVHDDWDLTTQARPARIRRLFRRTVPIGVDHGTVGVLARDGTLYEVTTFRRDVETFGRRAVVEFADRVEEDLARRDFTINAVAWHPLRDELLDPYGGLQDLDAARLRTVGAPAERFAEDYLRVLRALRFAGRYGLEIDRSTWEALREATPHLGVLSAERVREELIKVLSLDPDPSRSLELYRTSGAMEVVFPELAARCSHDPAGWKRSVARAGALPRTRPLVRLVALLAGLDRRTVAAFLIRLRFSNADAARVSELVESLAGPPLGLEPESLRRWLSSTGPARLNDWIRLQIADVRVGPWEGGPRPVYDPSDVVELWRGLRREIRSGAPLAVSQLALGGKDLIRMGLRPSPAFGVILDRLLDRALTAPELNTREALEPLARTLADEVVPERPDEPEAVG